jgi:hypothetical protein
VFYIFDNPDCRFIGNAYEFTGVSASGSPSSSVREPGLSFFDRQDQRRLIKLHLPYIWRTPDGVNTLFLPPLNRPAHGFSVPCGLVETDWYASPVNLVLGTPSGSVHVQAGDIMAQAIFLPRNPRHPVLEVAAENTQIGCDARKGLAEWDKQHAEDSGAYKIRARSRHRRVQGESRSKPVETVRPSEHHSD